MIISSNWTCRCLKKMIPVETDTNTALMIIRRSFCFTRFATALIMLSVRCLGSLVGESIIEARIKLNGKIAAVELCSDSDYRGIKMGKPLWQGSKDGSSGGSSKNDLSLLFIKKGCLRAHVVGHKFCAEALGWLTVRVQVN